MQKKRRQILTHMIHYDGISTPGAPLVSASLKYGVCVLLLYNYSRRGLIVDDAKHKLSSPSCGSALGLYNIVNVNVNVNANVCCGRSGQRSHVDRFHACLGAKF